jgi:hypothetical protein
LLAFLDVIRNKKNNKNNNNNKGLFMSSIFLLLRDPTTVNPALPAMYSQA